MAVSGSRSGRMSTEIQLTGSSISDRHKSSVEQKEDTEDQFIKVYGRRVPVVYYLSRNGQLDHPHFMEVSLSSSHGLLLRDVVDRLSVLRGKGMAAMYSWSCKRSYRKGFVWQDLLENDLIFPAHGDEYILKGSEISASEIPGTGEMKRHPAACTARRRNQSCGSIDTTNLREYVVCKPQPTADVSTQTDDARRGLRRPPPRDEIELSVSPPPSDSSSPETVETLMKSDEAARQPEDPSADGSRHGDQKAGKSPSSVLMQLFSCGSISCGAGHGGLGLISQYKMRVPRRRPKLEDKELFFSGSLAVVQTTKAPPPPLKRSNSYTAHPSNSIN